MDSEQVYVLPKGRQEKSAGAEIKLRKIRFRWAEFRTTHFCQIKKSQIKSCTVVADRGQDYG